MAAKFEISKDNPHSDGVKHIWAQPKVLMAVFREDRTGSAPR